MKRALLFICLILMIIFPLQKAFSQVAIEAGDPPNPTDIPDFYKSRLSDIQEEILNLKVGEAKVIAISPGGLPVYAVYYGTKDDFHSKANYNSAVAARDPTASSRRLRTAPPGPPRPVDDGHVSSGAAGPFSPISGPVSATATARPMAPHPWTRSSA